MSFGAAQQDGIQTRGQASADEEAIALACARQPLLDRDIPPEVISELSVRDLTRLAEVIAFEERNGWSWRVLVNNRLLPDDVCQFYLDQLLDDADAPEEWLDAFPKGRAEDLLEAIERAQELGSSWKRAWCDNWVTALEVVDLVLPELRVPSA